MIWNELIDRCLLHTSATRDVLRQLMKEGEQELSNKLELYDTLYTIAVPGTTSGLGVNHTLSDALADHNYMNLPHDYIRDNYALCNGDVLRKITEADIYRNNDNALSPGSPTAYAISGDFILFDTIPSTSDDLVLSYKSSIDRTVRNKVFTINSIDVGNNYIWLDTDLGSDLDGLTVTCGVTSQVLASGSATTVGMYPGPIDRNRASITATLTPSNSVTSRYTLSSGTNFTKGSLAVVQNYRSVGPLIPSRYHYSLCDYAVAISSFKTDPSRYELFWAKWSVEIDRHVQEAMDRDLIHTIRETI